MSIKYIHRYVFMILWLLILVQGCAHPTARNGDPGSPPAVPMVEPGAIIDDNGKTPPAPPAIIGSDAMNAAGVSENTGVATNPVAHMGETDLSDIAGGDAAPPIHTAQHKLDEALDFCDAAQEFWQNGELESALEALDKAYSLILNLEPDSPDKLIQQKEDLRFLISKRILEIYASRNIVVNGNHNAIPRDLNANVQKEINFFTKGPEKRFFIESYRRSGKYRDMIVSKLEAAGLPTELSWLPLIESGFKVQALSRARALGLWQFIPSTGYKFGLKRNQYVDERIDFEKSTDAAIAYLKELHGIFGDWATVLAAYNCGEGRVLHVIRTQNINYLDDFWDLYGRLPYETARYVPRFLATLHVIENAEKYGLNCIEPDPALAFEKVDVHRRVHLKNLAPALGLSVETLKELNPELRYSILPDAKYPLRVPAGQKALVLASIDKVPVYTPPTPAFAYHRVRKGETLSSIARRYGTSVKQIMRANRLRRSGYIVAGQRLKVPRRGTTVSASRAPATAKVWNRKHVVKSGDSLWIIAKRYGTTTKRIQEMNKLKGTMLSIHQVLRVPSATTRTSRSAKQSETYYVQKGESPYLIARKYNMSLNHFLKLNNLTPRSTIYPGQKVIVD
ncbi:LysM peptidoglycan-binding domain-containing protein [Desulfosarcina ovata]|uniref:LysM domain-containing protein n=1 Tax=Desulfosarcina ovata subsp. ovata TaxID=2752305 RepID=A0A5K8AIP9_9BACT|nr:LysM peptidoglycan-binding domain-containing protein [Desulfosarcina ovata]BBO92562.1 hypothetical protein DSCOOX_57420 [Desulfosarcina ovata subsp. ovata]